MEQEGISANNSVDANDTPAAMQDETNTNSDNVIDAAMEPVEGVADNNPDVDTTADTNVPAAESNEQGKETDDDIMQEEESEAHAVSMASAALLYDLERRYVDMSNEYNQMKVEYQKCRTQLQEVQQEQNRNHTDPTTAPPHAGQLRPEELLQLQQQNQAQHETNRILQEQKDHIQMNNDTLRDEIR
jgi:hypothetical protein